MKVQLRAGAELDLLTPEEAREIVLEALGFFTPEEPVTIRGAEQAKTDANGALTLEVYKVPPGMVFALNRLLLEADGFTPAVPFTNAAGWVDVLRSGKRVDFFALSTGIPAQSVDGSDQATKFRNGETVSVQFTGGPVSTNVEVTIQGLLSPLPDQRASRHTARHGHGRR